MNKLFFILFQLAILATLILTYCCPKFIPLTFFSGTGLAMLIAPINGSRGFRYLGLVLLVIGLVLTIVFVSNA